MIYFVIGCIIFAFILILIESFNLYTKTQEFKKSRQEFNELYNGIMNDFDRLHKENLFTDKEFMTGLSNKLTEYSLLCPEHAEEILEMKRNLMHEHKYQLEKKQKTDN